MTCKGVIPNTFIACGEGYNYCSDECIRQELRENGEANWIVGYQAGAAVAFGFIGMGEAIRKRYPVCYCGSVGGREEGIYLRCDRGHYFQTGAVWM